MTANAFVQCALYLVLLTALAVPVGEFMARVFDGRSRRSQRVLGPLENGIYRLAHVHPEHDMGWKEYAASALIFNLAGILVVYLLQRVQGTLPLNPAGMGPVPPWLAFNTAVSFATNTNWQAYGGETTLSYLTQMLGLTVQNFVSAAAGMAVLVALVRGFARRGARRHRQLLGRSDARHALHPAAAVARAGAVPGVAGRRADLRRLADRSPAGARHDRRRRSPWPTQILASGRRRRRSRSSNSAPTAAASSTSTRRTRSRTRRRSPTSSRCSRSC